MTTPAYYEVPESAWMFRDAAAARRIPATIGPGPLKTDKPAPLPATNGGS